MNGAGPYLASVVVAAIGFFGTWLVQRNQKKANTSTDTQTLIDQMQEDRQADRAQFAETLTRLEERQQRTERRLENAEGLFRIASDYILALRYHISEGKPPPPPVFPIELTKGMPGDR